MNYRVYKVLFIIALSLSVTNCARRGRPTGGKKDSIPPILVSTSPIHKSINFKAKKIKIYFDEYIKLKNISKQLVISPPLNNNPIITPVGTASKFISIKLLDTLKENTTYTFNFGNSIVDNNEDNELGNFKYIFSTGSYIDSLSISGEINDPMVKETVKNINVMLYEYNDSFTDSIIYKEKPIYIASTLDSTLFELTNLKAGKYLLIALKDANNNKIYNPKVDKIGYVSDTVQIPTDKTYNISLFKEVLELNILKPKEASKGHLIFGYEGDAKDLEIKILTQTPDDFTSKIIYEKNKDTINYWYTPFENDSLNFEVSKGSYLEKFTMRTRSSKIDSLAIKNNIKGILHLVDTFSISTSTPIVNLDKTLIKITEQDSTLVDFNAFLSKSKTKLYLDFEKKYNTQYYFELLPKTITDIFGFSNDTLSFKLKTKEPKNYGSISVDIKSTKKTSFIVELLNKNQTTIRIVKIKKPQVVRFKLLTPGDYLIRVTLDENNNGIWDTGSFLDKKHPEMVKYFDTLIELRANWDVNELFNLD